MPVRLPDGRRSCGPSPRGRGSRPTGSRARRRGRRRGRKLRRIVLPADDRARRRSPAPWPGADRRRRGGARPGPDQHPSLQKSPRWFADRVAAAAARRKGVTVTVRDEAELAAAASAASSPSAAARPGRRAWSSCPGGRAGATTHVVLVGKGITFDTGGYSHQAAGRHAADAQGHGRRGRRLRGRARPRPTSDLPVRVTALAPLAENMVSGSALRPGDVVRHYGGLTSEILQHRRRGPGGARPTRWPTRPGGSRPDLLVDLATLTGASHVALGKRTAALFSHDDALAAALRRGRRRGRRADVADAAGRRLRRRCWRSDVADLNNAPGAGAGRCDHRRAVPARVHRRPAPALGAHRHVGPGLDRRARRARWSRARPAGAYACWSAGWRPSPDPARPRPASPRQVRGRQPTWRRAGPCRAEQCRRPLGRRGRR